MSREGLFKLYYTFDKINNFNFYNEYKINKIYIKFVVKNVHGRYRENIQNITHLFFKEMFLDFVEVQT